MTTTSTPVTRGDVSPSTQAPDAPPTTNKLAALRQEVVNLARQDIRKIEVVDTDFVITTRTGQKWVVRDGALRAMMSPDFTLKLNDGAIKAQQILQNAEAFDVDAVARLTGRNANVLGNEPEAKPEASAQATQPTPASVASEADDKAQKALKAQAQPSTEAQPERAAARDASTASTAEGQAAKAAELPQVVGVTAQVEKASAGFFAGINPAWGALGALGALGASGGGGAQDTVITSIVQAAGAGTGTSTDATTQTKLVKAVLNVVLGEVNSKLSYVVKSATGEVLATGVTESVDGQFSLEIKTNYSGPVEITISDPDLNDGKGYRDEATGLSKNLDTSVRALAQLSADAVNTINVTPVTELATRWLYDPLGGNLSLSELTQEAVTAANVKVARALGLEVNGEVVDITGVTGLTALNDASAPSGAGALAYAQVLAALSGYDNVEGGSFIKTMDSLARAIRSLTFAQPTSSTVGTILATGSVVAMDNMVENGNYSALSAREFLNKVFSSYTTSLSAASLMFDSADKWIQLGANKLLLNFSKLVSPTDILNNLLIDGKKASEFGMLTTHLKPVSGSGVSNRQWELTFNGDMPGILSDADKRLLLQYKSGSGSTAMVSNEVSLTIGSVVPVVKSSGLVGSTGTRTPTYEVVSESGLVDVKVTLIDAKGVEQTITLTAKASSPTKYTYTLLDEEALTPGAYQTRILLKDRFGNVAENLAGNPFKLVGQPVCTLLSKDDTGWVNGRDGDQLTYDADSLTDLKTRFNEFTYVVLTVEGAEVKVNINGQELLAIESKTVPGRYEVTFYNLPDNVYSPSLRIKDLKANATSYLEFSGATVVVDTKGPSLKGELAVAMEAVAGESTSLTIALPAQDTGPVTGQPRVVTFWDELGGADAEFFTWADESHKQLVFRANTDFESKPVYVITLKAYDDVGNVTAQEFTVRITNRNEAPVLSQAIAKTFTEDAGGDAQGWVSVDLLEHASDPDALASANAEVLSVNATGVDYAIDGAPVTGFPAGLVQWPTDGKTFRFNVGHASLQSMREGDQRVYTISFDVRDKAGITVRQTATFTVRGANDRPMLNAALALALSTTATSELGAAAPIGAVGNRASDLARMITDADVQAVKGLAITGLAPGAKLWYSLNGGTSWQVFDGPSDTQALLLGNQDQHRVYVQAGAQTQAGTTLVAAMTVKAWDQTDGKSPGGTAIDTSGSAYSSLSLGLSQPITKAMDNATGQAFASAQSTASGSRIGTGSNVSVALGDFNGDGHIDVFAPWSGTAVADTLYLGKGDPLRLGYSEQAVAAGNLSGTFLSSGSSVLYDQKLPRATSVDFDNDGDLDVAMVSSNGNASLLLNQGNSSFINVGWATALVKQRATATTANLDLFGGKGRERMLFADFNGDGHVDVAWSNAMGGPLSVLNNLGNGTFGFNNGWALASGAVSGGRGPLLWGDFTGDVQLDLWVGSKQINDFTRLFTGGVNGYSLTNLTYTQANGSTLQIVDARTLHADFAAPTTPWSTLSGVRLTANTMAAADFDQDGRLDVFMGAGEVGLSNTPISHQGMLLRNNPGQATVLSSSSSSTSTTQWQWIYQRVNGDQQGGPALSGAVQTAAWMDYNMDGWLDLITSEGGANGIQVYLSKGKLNGVFQGFEAGRHASQTGLELGQHTALGFNVADLDGNGTQDLLVSTDAGTALFLNHQMPTTRLVLNVLGKVGSTPLYGAKVVVTQQDNPAVSFTQFVQGDTGEGTNQGELVFYGLDPSKKYDIAVTYAFDANATANGYDPIAQADSGVRLLSVTSKFLGRTPSTAPLVLRVDPSNRLEVGRDTADQFTGWNPTSNMTGNDALAIVQGTDVADDFDLDPQGARVYVGGAGTDTLRFNHPQINGSIVALNNRDATGVTGVTGYHYNTATNLYAATTPSLLGSDGAANVNTPTSQTRGGINFTGIDALELTARSDTVLDNVGMSHIDFGDANDRLILTDGAVFGDRAASEGGIVYDGGAGLGDVVDFSNLNLGNTRMRFEWYAAVGSDASSEGRMEVYLSTQNEVWATFNNFELVTGTAAPETFDYRGRMNAPSQNIVINGSNDVWYGTVASSVITAGDRFSITNTSKFSLGVKMFGSGVDASYTESLGAAALAAGNDALQLVMSNAYARLTTTTTTGQPKISLTAGESATNLGNWFTGTMDDASQFTFSNYKSGVFDFSGLDHGVKAGLQTSWMDDTALTRTETSRLIGTAFSDELSVGHYQRGSGDDVVESGRGNDTISITVGSGTSANPVPRNGTTRVVFGKYDAADKLYGNGTDVIKNFTLGKDAVLDAGEDILDMSALGLSNAITTSTAMSKYFKASNITSASLDIRFDQTGTGSNAAFTNTENNLVKLTNLDIGSWTTTDINNLLWNMKLAGQIVL